MSSFLDLEAIENIRKTHQPLSLTTISKSVQKEVRDLNNFKNGEIAFSYLREKLLEKKEYTRLDITAFQRAVSTLVRYAPDTKNSRYYFNLTLSEYEAPLRTPTLELTLLNNLVYVHSLHDMKEALSLVKTALDIKVFQFQVKEFYRDQPIAFNNPLQVFEDIASRVLRHHQLEFNRDKTDIRPYYKY